MLDTYDIKIKFDCQSLESTHLSFSPNRDKSVIFFKSSLKSEELKCPLCGGKVYIYDNAQVILKDMPIWAEVMCESSVHIHRYRCTKCNKTFTESIPFKYPGTRITTRAADWIKEFLRGKLSIKTIQEMTGIHWDTIRKIQKEMMDNAIYNREDELKKIGYKPKRLAVDEFAIHKGHSYATCVMDLDTGDVIWAGLGRALKDFQKFFDDVPSDYLSEVIAVAMDMNASYNKLVSERLPKAQIVYDRFHMQSQFGRDVLGVVRLDEARKHKACANEMLKKISEDTDSKAKQQIKQDARNEKREYSKLKRLRWTLLTNGNKLSDENTENLNTILDNHKNLAVCYAMKEEMTRLFELTDYFQALDGWTKWFNAAKSSSIPALVKFATQKEKRLPGLAAHAIFQISTGKLEGFNNKIKVAKRIAYGYRDDGYFFTLIRYLSLPSVRL